MHRRPGFATVLSALLVAARLVAEQTVPAPEGFTWRTLDIVNASFLLPNGWHFKEEQDARSLAYFLSEEDIGVQGQFETGLTLNVLHVSEDAQKRAADTVKALSQTAGNEVQDSWQTQSGVLKGFGVRIRQTAKGSDPLVMVVIAIGNSKTNAVYLLIFESPEGRWKKAWEKGERMVKEFKLDEEY